jgi:hypothetical protein
LIADKLPKKIGSDGPFTRMVKIRPNCLIGQTLSEIVEHLSTLYYFGYPLLLCFTAGS